MNTTGIGRSFEAMVNGAGRIRNGSNSSCKQVSGMVHVIGAFMLGENLAATHRFEKSKPWHLNIRGETARVRVFAGIAGRAWRLARRLGVADCGAHLQRTAYRIGSRL